MEVGLGLNSHLATYRALTDCELYQLDKPSVNRLLKRKPASILVLVKQVLSSVITSSV